MEKLASSGDNSLCKRFPKYIQCDGVLHNDLSAPPPPPFKLVAKELIIFCQYNWLQKFMLYILNQFVKSIFVMEINLSHNLTCRMDLLQSSKVKSRMVTHKYIFEIYSIVNPTTGSDTFLLPKQWCHLSSLIAYTREIINYFESIDSWSQMLRV